MDELIRIDTRLLRDQVSAVHSEKRIAQQLYSNVQTLISISDEMLRAEYRTILPKVDKLVRYYQSMEDALDEIADKACELSAQISGLLRDETDIAKAIGTEVFL